jgi:hypothetical protein
MNERQHHLNESSSAILGRSQQLKILPSPNSKQTQSLGADFSDGRIALAPIFLISTEILTSALFISYIMWRSNFTIPHSFAAYILEIGLYFGHPPIFWKSAYILEIRLYFGHPPIFWISAYILEIRLYFEQAPMFYACANILGKSQYFDNFLQWVLLDFVAANICVYFQYLFMHFYVRQYFWRNCSEA